jgi:gluconate kinase
VECKPNFVYYYLNFSCASGKTTIGKELAKRLNAEFIDGDDYHAPESIKKMSDGIGLNGFTDSLQ